MTDRHDQLDARWQKGLRTALLGDDLGETPPVLPGYRIERLLASGGTGLIYLATDLTLQRTIAVKVLSRRAAADRTVAARFAAEARVASSLQHPGTVPIHAAGTLPDGRPWFSMQVVVGETLAEALQRRHAPGEHLLVHLETFARICDTVAYAHARGICHGDLKPANVMIGAFGEVQVLDWGFATRADTTPSGEPARAIGTPAYMAPEQAVPTADGLEPRTDVFGLGGILLEILTGQPPYVAADQVQRFALASAGAIEPALARLAAGAADPHLRELVAACLEPVAAKRPPSAAAVADRVRAYLSHLERRNRDLALAVERGRRRRALAMVVTACTLLCAAVALWWQSERHAWRTERQRLVLAALAEAEVKQSAAGAAPTADPAAWTASHVAAEHAERLAREQDDLELRSRAARLLASAADGSERARREQRMSHWLTEVRPHLPADRGDKTDADFRQAFADYGLEIDRGDVAALGDAIRSSPLADELLTALDDWARYHRRSRQSDAAAWQRLFAIANAADADPWRIGVREAIVAGDSAALQGAATAVADGRTKPSAVPLLADALVEHGFGDAAVEALRQQLAHTGPDAWLLHELASSLTRRRPEARDEARRLLYTALAMRPASPHFLVDYAQVLIEDRRLDEAETLLLRATRLDPSHQRAWRHLAWTRMLQRRPLASAEAAERALAEGPPEAAVHQVRAQAALNTGDYDLALAHARQAVALAGGWQADLLLSAALEALGDHDAALAALDAARRAVPQFAPLQAIRGRLLLRSGNFAAAEAAFAELAETFRGTASTHATELADQQHRRAARLRAAASSLQNNDDAARQAAGDELADFAVAAWFTGDVWLAAGLFARLAAEGPTHFTSVRRHAIEATADALGDDDVPIPDREQLQRLLTSWLAAELADIELASRATSTANTTDLQWLVRMRSGPVLAPFRQRQAAAGQDWPALVQAMDRVLAGLVTNEAEGR